MWPEFICSTVYLVLFLFVPGTLACAPARLSLTLRVACAPVISSFIFLLESSALSMLHLHASWAALSALVLATSLLISVICDAWLPKQTGALQPKRQASPDAHRIKIEILLGYFVLGIIVASYFFVRNLDSAGSITQLYDNYSHINLVRTLVDSDYFFSFDFGIYPQAWIDLAALCACMIGDNVPVAVNALNFVLLSFVFPAAVFSFLQSIFPQSNKTLAIGMLLPLAFVPFPMSFITFGPLFPNLSGYAMLPMAASLLISIFSSSIRPSVRISRLLLFFASAIALFFLHQSAIFVGIVIMAPYCCHLFWSLKLRFINRQSTNILLRICLVLGFIFAILLIWYALYRSPALESTVQFNWPAFQSKAQSIISFLTLALTKDLTIYQDVFTHETIVSPQYALAALTLTGVCFCLIKRNRLWLVASYLLCAFIYCVNTSTDGPLKHFLSGFWYTDSYRIAAMVVIIAIPLAATGARFILNFIIRLLARIKSSNKLSRYERGMIVGLFSIAFLFTNFFPCLPVDGRGTTTPFGIINDKLYTSNSLARNSNALDEDEIAFCKEAASIVPEGSVVINIPHDGSMFVYGTCGLDVYFRSTWFDFGIDINASGDNDSLIRSKLVNYSSDPQVQEAVAATNASYVLLLDQGNSAKRAYYADNTFQPAYWTGISSIDDNTPGFEVVLAQDDMRLYRIVR